MKLLISSAYYTPHLSGLTISIKNLAELFVQNGYDVTVLTTQHQKSLPIFERINNVAVKRVPYLVKISKGFLMSRFLFETYDAVKSSDQVIINLPQMEGVLVAAVGKLLKKRVHTIYVCEVTLKGGFFAKLIEGLLRWANIEAVKLSDSVVTLTEDFASSTPVLLEYERKVTVIPPVIHQPEMNEVVSKKFEKLLPQKGARIGFLGRLSSEKGVEYLLDTIPQLKKLLPNGFTIIVAGPEYVVGEQTYQKKIQKQLDAYKENIVQIGELKDEEIGAFYSMLDVLVLPSINSTEVFGMVQVEAMLCGTPAVASDLPGVRVPITLTGMGEVTKPANTADIARKIAAVITYKKDYRKNKKAILEIFSTQKILASYRELFAKE